MNSATKAYFQHLDMVREDVREEFDILGIQSGEKRIWIKAVAMVSQPSA